MKKSINSLSIALCLISLSSCGEKKKDSSSIETSAAKEQQATKTHASTSKEFISALNEMSDTLTTVTDLDSAKAAIQSLRKAGLKIKNPAASGRGI